MAIPDILDTAGEVRYFTKKTLIRANRIAIATDRNRTLEPKAIAALEEHNFPVVFAMVHNDIEIRVKLVLDPKGGTAWLDIPFDTYYGLPVHQSQPSLSGRPSGKILDNQLDRILKGGK